MFVSLPPSQSSNPLDLSTPIRTKLDSLLSGRRRVAWLYENPDTSTFRYRVLNVIDALASGPSSDVGMAWFTPAELKTLESVVHQLDVLVVARYCYSGVLHQLVMRARRAGVSVLFESDDLVFDVQYAAVVADTLAQDLRLSSVWDSWFAYMGRLNASAKLCDGGITTNHFLGRRMSSSMDGKKVAVIRNFLNRTQQEYSKLLLNAKRTSGWRRNEKITIGYFSGSPTHVKDFAIAAPALARLLEADPCVRVRVAGYLDTTGPLKQYVDRVEILPHMDYVALQRSIAEVEINIAPLQENVFTNCKSELKFFEAAAVGSWTIATPTHTFVSSIEDGVTGRLARAHEWDTALAEAVALVRKPAEYAAKAECAAEAVYANYGWDRPIAEINAALFER